MWLFQEEKPSSFPRIFWRELFSAREKMKIVKVKGQQDRFFYEDVKMSFIIDTYDFLKITLPEGEIFGLLRRLPKTGDMKRIFYRVCGKEERLIPFPRSVGSTASFFPRKFAGNVLLRADSTVEKVLLKFALEGDRVIPINEWFPLANERHDRFLELVGERENFLEMDELDELLETCYINSI